MAPNYEHDYDLFSKTMKYSHLSYWNLFETDALVLCFKFEQFLKERGIRVAQLRALLSQRKSHEPNTTLKQESIFMGRANVSVLF